MEDMPLDGIRPDQQTYFAIILAAMRTRSMQHAQFYYNEMRTSGIAPTVSRLVLLGCYLFC